MGMRPCGSERNSECTDELHTKGTTNYMGGGFVAKLIRQETETAKPIVTRTDLVTSSKPTLLSDLSQPRDPMLWPGLEQCEDVSSIQLLRGL